MFFILLGKVVNAYIKFSERLRDSLLPFAYVNFADVSSKLLKRKYIKNFST